MQGYFEGPVARLFENGAAGGGDAAPLCIIDAGANVGLFALECRRRAGGKPIRVLCFGAFAHTHARSCAQQRAQSHAALRVTRR